MSKYLELRDLREVDDHQWDIYKQSCSSFIRDFREALVTYLECPNESLRWLHFRENFEDSPNGIMGDSKCVYIHPARNMRLYDNAYWQFQFRLELTDGKWVDLCFKLRKDEDVFTIVHEGTWTVRWGEGNREDMEKMLDDLFENLKDYLGNRFNNFIKEKPSTLGFKTGNELR